MHPILFSAGPFRVYTYGVLIALGGVLSALFWSSRRSAMGLRTEEDYWLFINAVLFGGFLGGRALYLLEYAGPSGWGGWRAALSLTAGFSVMGAFVGILASLALLCRHLKTGFLRLLDYVCAAAPFWHFFGRLGCFAAGCCVGRPPRGTLPWAVVFTDPRSQVPPAWLGLPLHPAQLYEAFADLVLAALLFSLVLPKVESGRLPRGFVCAAYFAGYGLLRFALEFYRGDAIAIPRLGLTVAQAFSVSLLGLAAAIALHARQKPCIPS